jgi:Nodulation protein Z (NodZ)
MLGVHVRYTDRRARLTAILKKVDAVRRRDRCPIFLATDNAKIHELFLERYHDVVSTPHWYAPNGARIHQSRACRDRLENGVEALIDLYLLAECDYLVGDSTSAFAKVAGLLSAAPASRRYDAKAPRVFNVRHGQVVEGAAREAVTALRAHLRSRRRH